MRVPHPDTLHPRRRGGHACGKVIAHLKLLCNLICSCNVLINHYLQDKVV